MKIWLDDLRPMPPHYDIHARTATEAIHLLAAGLVTDISLDHDLGDEADGTGYDVARWIEEAAYRWTRSESDALPPLRWALHSQNPVGRAAMAQALQNADRFWAARPS